MASATSAKKAALGSMAFATGLSVFSNFKENPTKAIWMNTRVVTAGFIATAGLLALADAAPDVASGLALLIVVSSLLTPWATGSRTGMITSVSNALWPKGKEG